MINQDERVCPCCGEAAGDHRFCSACGLNLGDLTELPARREWEEAQSQAPEPATPPTTQLASAADIGRGDPSAGQPRTREPASGQGLSAPLASDTRRTDSIRRDPVSGSPSTPAGRIGGPAAGRSLRTWKIAVPAAIVVVAVVALVIVLSGDHSPYRSVCQHGWSATWGGLPAEALSGSGAPSESTFMSQCEASAQQVEQRCTAHGGVRPFITYEQNNTSDQTGPIPSSIASCQALAKYAVQVTLQQDANQQ
jgi:hypothetical protein